LPDPDGAGPLASPVITVGYDNLSRQVSETDALGGVTYTNAN
jgi:YD repeat-containing protein